MTVEQKATSDGQTSPATKQPEKEVEALKVMDRDPKTGQRREKEIQLTKEEKDALAQKGYRFEQEMGFLKTKSREEAVQMATEMTQTQMQQFIAALQAKQPELKAPTADEVQENPQVLVDYVNKVNEKAKEDVLTTVRKELDEKDKQKAKDDEMLIAYDTEIKAVLPDFPFLPRSVLVDAIQVRHTDIPDIRDLAERLHTEILANIDVDKLPEGKRKEAIEKLKAESKDVPPPGPEGSAADKKDVPAKNVDAVYEAEAKKYGWTL